MIEVTCSCGRVLQAPDSAIGKKGRCKGCGQVVQIISLIPEEPVEDIRISLPAGGPLDDEPDMEDLARSARRAPAPVPLPAIDTSERDGPRPTMPPEPFYYGFLVFYAWSCIVLAIGQFGIVMLGVMAQVQQVPAESAVIPPVSGAIVLVSIAWMLGIILISCPILLAVDAARNLRALRYASR